MIRKQYYQTINVYSPKNYFENWYADLWHRHFESSVKVSTFEEVFRKELGRIGATLDSYPNGRYSITFRNDRDYTLFVLRWT